MRSKSMLPLALMLAASALGALPPAPVATQAQRAAIPRKFTDARKAEAQAKRDRKAARRLKERT